MHKSNTHYEHVWTHNEHRRYYPALNLLLADATISRPTCRSRPQATGCKDSLVGGLVHFG